MNELEMANLIFLLGDKLHEQAVKQADEIIYGSSYIENDVGGCRVDSEINFYDLARVAIEFMEEQ